MRVFYTITITQVLSLIGSSMTSVALGIRVFADTGNSAPLLFASFFNALPMMVGGLFAGALVDRWQRRHVLIASDAGQAAGTAFLLLMFLAGRFELWHLYTVALLQGVLGMFQRPAMEASVTMLAPVDQRDRANAIRQMAGPAAAVIAPVVTGFFYAFVGVTGVMVVDLITFAVAVVVVYLVRIPQPRRPPDALAVAGSLRREIAEGFAFVWQRPILLFTMLWAAFANFLLVGPMRLTTPYIMTITGSTETLGLLLGTMNLGIVVGGVIMSVWGGTRPRIHGIMLGLLFRAFWMMVYGVTRTPLTLGLALFFVFFTNALIDASAMSLFQLKTPAHLQGRVFALLFQLMFIANPLSYAVTAPLVDDVLTPAVGKPGWERVAPLVGSDPASGMGMLITCAGALMFVTILVIYALPHTRRMEATLPDYAVETA